MKNFLILIVCSLFFTTNAATNVYSPLIGYSATIPMIELFDINNDTVFSDIVYYVSNECSNGYSLMFNNSYTNAELHFIANNSTNLFNGINLFVVKTNSSIPLELPQIGTLYYDVYSYNNGNWFPELPVFISANTAFFLYNPSNINITTYLFGKISNTKYENSIKVLNCNYGLIGCPALIDGDFVSDLEFPAQNGDEIYRLENDIFITNKYNGITWSLGKPEIKPMEAFFIKRFSSLVWNRYLNIPEISITREYNSSYIKISWAKDTDSFVVDSSITYPPTWKQEGAWASTSTNKYYRFIPSSKYPFKFYRLRHSWGH